MGSVGWAIKPDDIAAIGRPTSPIWSEIAAKGDMFCYWARYGKPKAQRKSKSRPSGGRN